nr:hypothetical protein [Lutispora thermophila]
MLLHNEASEAHKELRKHNAKEITFFDLTLDEARQLHTFDEYFKGETAEPSLKKPGRKSRRSYFLKQSVFYRKKSAKLYCCTTLRE